MLREYDHVRIKKTGITGIIVDVPQNQRERFFTVESDDRDTSGGYGTEGSYKLYDCLAEELEKI